MVREGCEWQSKSFFDDIEGAGDAVGLIEGDWVAGFDGGMSGGPFVEQVW